MNDIENQVFRYKFIFEEQNEIPLDITGTNFGIRNRDILPNIIGGYGDTYTHARIGRLLVIDVHNLTGYVFPKQDVN